MQKPRGRKQQSHKKAYASVTVLVLIGVVGVAFAYVSGYFPGTEASTSNTISSSSNSSTASTSANCPAPPVSSIDTFACIDTSQGKFEVELFTTGTPNTVANFVHLANTGFFNDLVWHRIVPGFVIQNGDNNSRGALNSTRPTWGNGGSKTPVPFEIDPSLHNNVGYLGMASTGAGTGGTSQFYINLVNNSAILDGKYAVFGRVVSGMSVVDAIARVQTYCEPSPPNNPPGCAPGGYPEQPVVASQAILKSITILGG